MIPKFRNVMHEKVARGTIVSRLNATAYINILIS